MADNPGASQPSSASAAQNPLRTFGIPLLYFNGFALFAAPDFACILMVDGQPQFRLAMSASTAKSLAEQLSVAVNQFEALTKSKILTIEEVTALSQDGAAKRE